MTNKNKLLSILFPAILLVALGAFWWVFRGSQATIRSSVVETPVVVEKTFRVVEKLASVSAEFSVREGETALELLEKTHKTIVKKYSFGSLVESIDGVANGKDKKYWIYYVNGKAAEVGADQYKLQAGDVVEWRFEISKQ